MSRALAVVDDRPEVVLEALRRALDGGPAVLPLADIAGGSAAPRTVSPRVALVVQSSGSTGQPKRVALSAEALLASAAGSAEALGGQGQWLLALPAHYIAGINVLVRSMVAGTEPVVVEGDHFDPHAFIDAAAQMQQSARFTSLVPAQLAALIATDDALETLRSFNRILVGGQSTPQRLLAQALELGLNITRSYGSSETSGGCVYDGIPFTTVTMRIVDGEVELGGPTLAEGYLADDERTAQHFYTEEIEPEIDREIDGQMKHDDAHSTSARWYRTSDAGTIVDGVLSVTGRLDDVIISGGVKVSLGAIERVVTSLPGLEDAVVVARGHARWGEVPVVVCTTSVLLDDVRAVVGELLGPEARPAEVIIVDSIPRLSSGKRDRKALGALTSPHSQ